jgi:hypothetical protein
MWPFANDRSACPSIHVHGRATPITLTGVSTYFVATCIGTSLAEGTAAPWEHASAVFVN